MTKPQASILDRCSLRLRSECPPTTGSLACRFAPRTHLSDGRPRKAPVTTPLPRAYLCLRHAGPVKLQFFLPVEYGWPTGSGAELKLKFYRKRSGFIVALVRRFIFHHRCAAWAISRLDGPVRVKTAPQQPETRRSRPQALPTETQRQLCQTSARHPSFSKQSGKT